LEDRGGGPYLYSQFIQQSSLLSNIEFSCQNSCTEYIQRELNSNLFLKLSLMHMMNNRCGLALMDKAERQSF